MLDREIASAMRFLIDTSDKPHAYYYSIPEEFKVPSIYFPQPNITTLGDTLFTYALEFSWYVTIFDVDTQSAQVRASASLNALQYNKCVIPLIDENGALVGRGFRIKDPSMRNIDDSVARLILKWDSPRPYHDTKRQGTPVDRININWTQNAYESAVNQIGGNYGSR